MRFIPAKQVHDLLDYPSLVDTLAEAHRGEKPVVDRSELHHETGGSDTRQTFLNLPAWIPGRAMGIKMVTVMPENEKAWELPTVHAVYQLFDGKNGEPLAAIDGTALTVRKTAADSALGTRFLARKDVRSHRTGTSPASPRRWSRWTTARTSSPTPSGASTSLR